jgi:HD superfamily phosphohydrolase
LSSSLLPTQPANFQYSFAPPEHDRKLPCRLAANELATRRADRGRCRLTALPPQLEPANAIHDPVHGRVWLTQVEMDLINTPEFQRLRGIGQLTPVDLVFPGATHNRFAHSIGAAHVIGMITSHGHVAEHFEGDRGELVQALRLAALLHDIGHLPFSHVGEMAWLAAGRPDPFAYHEDPSGPLTVLDTAAAARADHPLHEDLSELIIGESQIGEIIDQACGEIAGEPASRVVQRIVAGTYPDLVVRNLLSSDLDCDRLDYLLRDSMTAGLVYGHIDLAYLVGAMMVAEGPEGPVLAIDGKHGLLTGEHFLLARYFHYAQFVSHKTVAAAEVTLVAALLELIRLEKLPATMALTDPTTDSRERIATLMTLTDAHVEAKIADAALGDVNEPLTDIARRLVERKLPKVAARSEALEEIRKPGGALAHVWDRALDSPEQKQKIADHCGVNPRTFCYRSTAMPLTGVEGDISPSGALQDPEKLRRGVRKAAKVVFDSGEPELLIDRSPILKRLSNCRWTTRRVFVPEPLDTYSPRQPSAAFRALKEYFSAFDDPSR